MNTTFLNEFALKTNDFNLKQEFLINGFLPKKLITMIYAEGGIGKSYLSVAIAKRLLSDSSLNVVYLDFDNPIVVLKNRGIDTLIRENANLSYLHRSSINVSPLEIISMIDENANGHNYENSVFIMDSIRDIVDIRNDNKVLGLMNSFKNIREAGGSILLLSHSNKDGRNYEGSVNIRNSIDCMYLVKKRPSCKDTLNFVCEVRKERAGIISSAFSVDTRSLDLTDLDVFIASMNENELQFVDDIKLALANGGKNKTDLLECIGKNKDDKTARDMLSKYEGIFYKVSKLQNRYFYESL